MARSCDLRIQDWQLKQIPGTPHSYDADTSIRDLADCKQDPLRSLGIGMVCTQATQLGLTSGHRDDSDYYHISLVVSFQALKNLPEPWPETQGSCLSHPYFSNRVCIPFL